MGCFANIIAVTITVSCFADCNSNCNVLQTYLVSVGDDKNLYSVSVKLAE